MEALPTADDWAATSNDEYPLYMSSGDDALFGILTRPTGPENGTTVVALNVGSWMPCTGRNRMHVHLGRRLAGLGYHTLRVDYHGVGESTGSTDYFYLRRPNVPDAVSAVEHLTRKGHERFVLVGNCFGGRCALAASQQLENLAGVAMIATPLEDHRGASKSLSWHIAQVFTRRTLKRIRHRGRRAKYLQILRDTLAESFRRKRPEAEEIRRTVSPFVFGALKSLIERRIPVLLMYGRNDSFYSSFLGSCAGPLGDLIKEAGDLVRVEVTDGRLHGQPTLDSQAKTLVAVGEWLETIRDPATRPVASREASGSRAS